MTYVASQNSYLSDALDRGPWTTYQKAIVALTAAAVVFDGLDIQIVGFAIPAIAHDWGIAKSVFASVLAAGLFGVAVGSVIGGIAGDRIGRRRALILNVFFFAAATIGMPLTHSLTSLFLLRFCAGLGIGGALPNAATLTSEFTPLNRRPFATTMTIICIPVGGVVAGLFASSLLPGHSWRTLFFIAGLLPMLHGFLLTIFLPESPRFLSRNPAHASRLRKVLEAMKRPLPSQEAMVLPTESVETCTAPTPRALLTKELAHDTLALWTAFFFCLFTVYLVFNWLPSVLIAYHFTGKQASQGLTLYNFGGIIGAVAVGWWISLKGSRFPMSFSAFLAIVSAAILALLTHAHAFAPPFLLGLITIHGLTVNAVQTTLYALATHLYVTSIRSTGVAFALAIGRTGAIASAYLGARLLSLHTSTYFVVLATAVSIAFISILVIDNHIKASANKTPAA